MSTELLTPTTLGGLRVRKAAERPPNINLLVYAESGWGKTTLAGSSDAVPEMRKVAVLDFEGGDLSLSHSYPNVDIIPVKDWVDVQSVYDELHAGGHGYQTIVIDSLTEIQKLCMYWVMKRVIDESPNREEFVPSMREWGINLEMMRKFVRGMRDLPYNVIFTALVADDRNQRTGITTKKPSLSGKLKNEVAAFLDVVAYGYMKEVTDQGETKQMRLLLTQSTDEVIAKDRTGKLPQVVVEPDMKQLYSLFDLTNSQPKEKAS
jgi:phage nucleotide-binding protein